VSWLQVLLDFFRELLPVTVIRSYQHGVRFTFGRATGPLRPGIYLRLPLLWEIEPVTVAEQTIDVTQVTVTTRDGEQVCLSANIVYAVTDGLLAYTAVDLYPLSLARLAATSLHAVGRRVTFDTLRGHQRSIERRIRDDLQRGATAWGIEVRRVGLTDFAKARAVRLYVGEQPGFPGMDRLV
jgi:regulator of protease activity HflC (stomatin/prohibitin superfamily)